MSIIVLPPVTGGGGSPTTIYTERTYAQAASDVAGGSLTPGVLYKVTRSGSPVFLLALSNNRFDLCGTMLDSASQKNIVCLYDFDNDRIIAGYDPTTRTNVVTTPNYLGGVSPQTVEDFDWEASYDNLLMVDSSIDLPTSAVIRNTELVNCTLSLALLTNLELTNLKAESTTISLGFSFSGDVTIRRCILNGCTLNTGQTGSGSNVVIEDSVFTGCGMTIKSTSSGTCTVQDSTLVNTTFVCESIGTHTNLLGTSGANITLNGNASVLRLSAYGADVTLTNNTGTISDITVRDKSNLALTGSSQNQTQITLEASRNITLMPSVAHSSIFFSRTSGGALISNYVKFVSAGSISGAGTLNVTDADYQYAGVWVITGASTDDLNPTVLNKLGGNLSEGQKIAITPAQNSGQTYFQIDGTAAGSTTAHDFVLTSSNVTLSGRTDNVNDVLNIVYSGQRLREEARAVYV